MNEFTSLPETPNDAGRATWEENETTRANLREWADLEDWCAKVLFRAEVVKHAALFVALIVVFVAHVTPRGLIAAVFAWFATKFVVNLVAYRMIYGRKAAFEAKMLDEDEGGES